MPLRIQKRLERGQKAGVWEMTEPLSYFKGAIVPAPEETALFDHVPEPKALERYCSRYLIRLLTGNAKRIPCIRDANGKPVLVGSELHLSLSHSGPYIAAVVAPMAVGIDIQLMQEKIFGIAGKFVNEEECKLLGPDPSLEALHFIWGAKESMYKAYGKRGLRFSEHMVVEGIPGKDGSGVKGKIDTGKEKMRFNLQTRMVGPALLVLATEENTE